MSVCLLVCNNNVKITIDYFPYCSNFCFLIYLELSIFFFSAVCQKLTKFVLEKGTAAKNSTTITQTGKIHLGVELNLME